MGLLTHLVLSALYLVMIAIDILMFFFVIRIVRMKWEPQLVVYFDELGKPSVDCVLGVFDHQSLQPKASELRQGARLGISLACLWILRLAFQGLVIAGSGG